MNKKILVVTVSLLLVAMFVTPTMAMNRNPKNPKKIEIQMVRSGNVGIPTDDTWITKGNVLHTRGFGITWDDYNIVDIQNTGAENMSILGGFYTMTGKLEVNLNNPGTTTITPFGIGYHGTGHIFYKVLIDFGGGNTFKGVMTNRGTFVHFKTGPLAGYTPLHEGVSRSVLQGTGIYKGYTIIWQREPIPGPNPDYIYWDAYMLIP